MFEISIYRDRNLTWPHCVHLL